MEFKTLEFDHPPTWGEVKAFMEEGAVPEFASVIIFHNELAGKVTVGATW